jgi:hypothetical protein
MLMIEKPVSHHRRGFPMVCSENQTIESKSVMISRLKPGTMNRKDGKMKVTPAMFNGINGQIESCGLIRRYY